MSGDTTIHEYINGLDKADANLTMLFIPTGTGNATLFLIQFPGYNPDSIFLL